MRAENLAVVQKSSKHMFEDQFILLIFDMTLEGLIEPSRQASDNPSSPRESKNKLTLKYFMTSLSLSLNVRNTYHHIQESSLSGDCA